MEDSSNADLAHCHARNCRKVCHSQLHNVHQTLRAWITTDLHSIPSISAIRTEETRSARPGITTKRRVVKVLKHSAF